MITQERRRTHRTRAQKAAYAAKRILMENDLSLAEIVAVSTFIGIMTHKA